MQHPRRVAALSRPTALLPRAPSPQDDSARPTTRRRISHKSDDDDDDNDNDQNSTTTRCRKKPKTTSSVSSTDPTDLLLAGSSSGSIASFDNLAVTPGGSVTVTQAVATGSALAGAASKPTSSKTGLPEPALHALIGGGSIAFIAIITCIIVVCIKRRRAKRDAANWPGYSPDGAFEAGQGGDLPVPGKGPGARGERLKDEVDLAPLEKYGSASDTFSPVDEKQSYDLEAGLRTPNLAQQGSDAPLTPSHPDYKPPRPPRPSEQYSFSSSPIKTVTHQPPTGNATKHSHTQSQGLNTYQRNLLALTTSMSFEASPHVRTRTATAGASEPASGSEGPSPFADPEVPTTMERKPSRKLNNKKDTLIGLAESYGDAEDEGDLSEQTMPLTIRNPNQLGRSNSSPRTPDLAPTLSMVDMPVSAAESMRDLESVLDSFGFDNRPESMAPMPATPATEQLTLGNRAPNRGLLVPAIVAIEAAGAGNAKSGYRVTRPSAGVGVSLVSNVNSIHSTVGELGDASSILNRLPASATSPNLVALARSGSVTKSGLTRSETSPSLASKRQSVVSLAPRSSLARRSQPALPLNASADLQDASKQTLPTSISLRRMSVMTTDTYPDYAEDALRASSSPFALEEDAKLARALSLSKKAHQEESGSGIAQQQQPRQRQRSNSVAGQKLAASSRVARSRTSTAYGGQMPPTPAVGASASPNPRLRSMTTESEAVFAVGNSMLAAFPDTPNDDFLRSPQVLQMLHSPDLLIQPPSPTIGSTIARPVDPMKKERQYQAQLAKDGFVPLAQMALSANGYDHHYRSPIDSIVGVFEYDERQQHK